LKQATKIGFIELLSATTTKILSHTKQNG